jgi:hypothetical protein
MPGRLYSALVQLIALGSINPQSVRTASSDVELFWELRLLN